MKASVSTGRFHPRLSQGEVGKVRWGDLTAGIASVIKGSPSKSVKQEVFISVSNYLSFVCVCVQEGSIQLIIIETKTRIKKHKLIVAEQLWEYKVQYRE